MKESYITEQIGEVKKYLKQNQYIDSLYKNPDKLKSIVMNSNYWENRQNVIKLVWSKKINISEKQTRYNNELYDDEYKYYIPDGSVIADLCEICGVTFTSNFGNKLDDVLIRNKAISLDTYAKRLSDLQQTLKKNIVQKFNFSVDAKELSDDQIYQIVSKLPDFETEGKKLLLACYNQDNSLAVGLEQPKPSLFNLLADKNLLSFIDEYKEKPLEKRKKDPLRKVFQWNSNKENYSLDNITKNGKAIKQWFMNEMKGITQDKNEEQNKTTVYFVLLELFGKDFEFGGNYNIPKAKLWDKVDEKEVKKWYSKNMPDTDLFDNLVLEMENTEEDEKNYINDADSNINTKNQNKGGHKKEKTETSKSKTGYIIGLIANILATVLFICLVIKISLLFFIPLVITVPIGIYCLGILCGCCLSFGDSKIKAFGSDDSAYFYSETREPENELNQDKELDL